MYRRRFWLQWQKGGIIERNRVLWIWCHVVKRRKVTAAMKGLIHIYCGDGKGKTTAAVGLAVRAAGHGKRELFLQFMKDGTSGEFRVLADIPGITVFPGEKGVKFAWSMSEQEKEDARTLQNKRLKDAAEMAEDYDLLILDEAVGTCEAGFLDKDVLCSFLDDKPESLEVVLTGRSPGRELSERADYISEIKKIRHPFDRGIKAREGIEQ